MTNNGTTSRKQLHRVLLWAALVVSGTCNAVTSIAGLGTAVSVVFGVLTVICAVGLFINYRRN